ncbi:MAG TPA: hypothetical protein HPQ04_07975 [Rhodospirillaceae bacterium]|nr:hypothetical protein [Rhodospirillaceae bacterium]
MTLHPEWLWAECFQTNPINSHWQNLRSVCQLNRKLTLVFEHFKIMNDIYYAIDWTEVASGPFQQLDHLIHAVTSCQRHMTEFSQTAPARFTRLEDDIQAAAASIDRFLSELQSFKQRVSLSPKEKKDRLQKLSKKLAHALPYFNSYIKNYDDFCRKRDPETFTILINDSVGIETARNALALWERIFTTEFPKHAGRVFIFNKRDWVRRMVDLIFAMGAARRAVSRDGTAAFLSRDADRFLHQIAVGMNYIKEFRDAINKLQLPDLYRRSLYGK